MNYLVLGYYGFFNSGDDAILHAVCQDIKAVNPKNKIVVMSNNPESTEKEYGVRAINRFSVKDVFKAMSQADIVVFGGGSLLQDVTSSKSLYYYLGVMKMATLMKKKTILYANGVGPIKEPANQIKTRKILKKLTKVTVRDEESYDFVRGLGVSEDKLTLTADPVYNLQTEKQDLQQYLQKQGIELKNEYIPVMFRKFGDNLDYVNKMADICDSIIENFGFDILFTPMEYPNDYELMLQIQKKMKNKSYIINERIEIPMLFEIIDNAKIVFSMRLHGLIYASVKNKPMIAFTYDPKVDSFCKQMGVDYCIDYKDIRRIKFFENLDEILCNYESVKASVTKHYEVIKQKTLKNRKILEKLEKGKNEK